MLDKDRRYITDSQEDKGVSPVIGVILMVAVTVVLAAVISVFLLGATDQFGDPVPTATFDIEFEDDGSEATIEHVSGASIQTDSLRVLHDGDDIADVDFGENDTLRVGNTFTVTPNDTFADGETVTIIFESGDSGYPLAEFTVQL